MYPALVSLSCEMALLIKSDKCCEPIRPYLYLRGKKSAYHPYPVKTYAAGHNNRTACTIDRAGCFIHRFQRIDFLDLPNGEIVKPLIYKDSTAFCSLCGKSSDLWITCG